MSTSCFRHVVLKISRCCAISGINFPFIKSCLTGSEGRGREEDIQNLSKPKGTIVVNVTKTEKNSLKVKRRR